MNKDQKTLSEILLRGLNKTDSISTLNISFLNKSWALFNLKNGYIKRLQFNQLYNELVDLKEISSQKLPIATYTGVGC